MSQWQYIDETHTVANRVNADGSEQSSLVVGGVVQTDGSTDIASCDLSVAKRNKTAAAEAVFGGKLVTGFGYSAKVIQIDPNSQQDIIAKAVSAQVSIGDPTNHPWPTGFYWRTADNTPLTLDAAGMIAMAAAVDHYITGLLFHLFGLKDAIAAATDQASVDAVDLASGWPTS